jgi:hypothetical protein
MTTIENPNPENQIDTDAETIHEPRLWQDRGWTAKVVKNYDGEGWAVEMYRGDNEEPALVGPWTMGRNKVDPKPLDVSAFHTLVKTAAEVISRHEQQLHAQLNKQVYIDVGPDTVKVELVITPDEYEPFGTLTAYDKSKEIIAAIKVAPTFRLTVDSASSWAAGGYARMK